eukprot:Opistho-1_new@3621
MDANMNGVLSTEAKLDLSLDALVSQAKKDRRKKGKGKGKADGGEPVKMEVDGAPAAKKKRNRKKKGGQQVIAGKEATKISLGNADNRAREAGRATVKAKRKALREQKVAASRGIESTSSPKKIRPKLGASSVVVVKSRNNAVANGAGGEGKKRRRRRKSGSSDAGGPAAGGQKSGPVAVPNMKISFSTGVATPPKKAKGKKPAQPQMTPRQAVSEKNRQRAKKASANARQAAVNKMRGIEAQPQGGKKNKGNKKGGVVRVAAAGAKGTVRKVVIAGGQGGRRGGK